VQTCLDRLRFWRTLQELAGVRNEHVVEAVARAREDVESKVHDELDQLQASHAEELERVRSEAAGAAMQGLAQMLLDSDPGSLTDLKLPREGTAVVAPPSQPLPASAPVEQPTEQVEAEAPGEPTAELEESVSFDEPWIESVLCTSCNDCTNLNPRVFVYDENKQAYIDDATAGTYAQIVEAAEKCPADCIHPGMPLDKSEPDLEELIKRAEPFN
jgi:ferredoxin